MDFSRKSGVLLHPTSLPSKEGIGTLGEYAYKFVDWLKEANQTLWQILYDKSCGTRKPSLYNSTRNGSTHCGITT